MDKLECKEEQKQLLGHEIEQGPFEFQRETLSLPTQRSVVFLAITILLITIALANSPNSSTQITPSSNPLVKFQQQVEIIETDQCTPIYKECTCQTTTLSCLQVEQLTNDLEKFINELTAREADAPYIIDSMVRLPFYDAADYNPSTFAEDGFRADGCVSTPNAGLSDLIKSLDSVWKPWCSVITRADFWVLAGKVAVESVAPYLSALLQPGGDVVSGENSDLKDVKVVEHSPLYWIPYRYGRIDTPNCSGVAEQQENSNEIDQKVKDNVINKFGLDSPHAAAPHRSLTPTLLKEAESADVGFLAYFANAYVQLTEAGYGDGSLHCAYCPPPNCKHQDCTEEEICTSGIVFSER